MTPRIQHLTDDRDKALAVCEDLWRVLHRYRVGLFARQSDRLLIAISDPLGGDPFGMTKGEAPSARQFVAQWRDFCNVESLMACERTFLGPDERAEAIHDGICQVLRHFDSAIIPAPVEGEPTMLLCDGVPGNWRTYSVIAHMDCYGYTERGIKPRRVM